MGKRPRLALVHDSVVNAETTWNAQKPLAERFELVVPNRRGFPPGPGGRARRLRGGGDACDVLADRVGPRRAVLPGTGHSVQRLGAAFNELLAAFVEQNEPPVR